MKTTLTKRVTFSAGHRLYNPNFNDEKNLEIFGACSNPGGHGHNYVLEVTVSGEINRETGMIINLKELKRIMEAEIISKVDHKNLNLDVDFMSGVIPTTENLARKIWEILDRALGNSLLDRIVVWESENNKIEISR
ncbi:MAG: 6-carboxytetrahydropterin synthase [Candidatus Zixiibacteriota bacterium]